MDIKVKKVQLLQAEHITFSYDKSRMILDDVSLSCRCGEWLTLLGPNGTGKSTLLKCMLQQIQPLRGKVTIDNQRLKEMSSRERARKIAYVPQSLRVPFAMPVVDAILTGRLVFSPYRYTAHDHDIVEAIIDKVRLNHLAFRNVNELSGGERQRVWIARALAQEAPLICLDEPTTGMDPENQLLILDLIRGLTEKQEIGVMMTLHDLNLAGMYSDRVALLYETKIFDEGRPEEVLHSENIRHVYHVQNEVRPYGSGVQVQILRNLL